MPSEILVHHKNLSEVLSAVGLIILADSLESHVTRCRFGRTKTVSCTDNVFRSTLFEFEHPDYESLLQRISALQIDRVDGKVALLEHGREIITLDWFDMGGFIGDKGNFSKADKLTVVKSHHTVFGELATADRDLFSLSLESSETNYLANFSQLKKNYIDAGGVYDSADTRFFARDFLLIVAFQNFRSVMTKLISEGSVTYGLAADWTVPAGLFAAFVGGGACQRYQATVKGFGKDGLVLAVATEVASPAADGLTRARWPQDRVRTTRRKA